MSACEDQDSPRFLCIACSGVSQSPARNVSPWILGNYAGVPGRGASHKTVPPFLLSPSAHPGNSTVTHTSNPYTLKSTGERQISLQLSQKTEERLTLPFACQTSHSSSPNIPFFLRTTTLKYIYISPIASRAKLVPLKVTSLQESKHLLRITLTANYYGVLNDTGPVTSAFQGIPL